eukprot:scaffold5479_cov199-Amphora_coffeaeformis.AAC.1
MQDFEVVGLLSCSNGRSCTLHECCGEEVVVGDVLRLVACTVSVDGAVEEAIKVVKVVDGDSNNTYKKDKSYKNCGMARVSILDEEGQKE